MNHRNRIALLQKEEERSRKKIDQARERAEEIIAIRNENEKRVQAFIDVNEEEQNLQIKMRSRNQIFGYENRKVKLYQAEKIQIQRKVDVVEMKNEKKLLTKFMVQEQEKMLLEKQQKHEEVKRIEIEAKLKREVEKRNQEKKMRDFLAQKAHIEEQEAGKAEKLVRILENKEREWILKLQEAQHLQESAVQHLQEAIVDDSLNIQVSSDKIRKKSKNLEANISSRGGSRASTVPSKMTRK